MKKYHIVDDVTKSKIGVFTFEEIKKLPLKSTYIVWHKGCKNCKSKSP
jgi:hypothetical protein